MTKPKPKAEHKPVGRPSKYTPELASEICARMASGRSLRDVCRDEDMPDISTVIRWLADDEKAEFRAQYARAREAMADVMAEEVLEISDDGSNDWMLRFDDDGNSTYVLNGEHVQRSRLRVDARKWLLSKVSPRKYGEKIGVEHSLNESLAEVLDAARKRLAKP